MATLLDPVLFSLAAASDTTPSNLLKAWLDQLYEKTPIYGLDSKQLLALIRIISESTAISTSTKLYIIENCLLPNEYVSDDVVLEIIRRLGTPTLTVRYKLHVPLGIQTALVKWLVQVYFLLPKNKVTINPSIWLHLWQYNYLQRWISYIIIWTTTSKQDIKVWKVRLLEKIAFIPGYQESTVLATAVLNRYETVMGSSKTISDLIIKLNANQKSLKTFQNLEPDAHFIEALKKVLVSNKFNHFTDRSIDGIINSYYILLGEQAKMSHMIQYTRNAVAQGKISILDIQTLEQLVQNWDRVVLPNHVDFLFQSVTKEGLKLSTYVLKYPSAFLNHVYEYITAQLIRCFNPKEGMSQEEKLRLTNRIVKYCLLNDEVVPKVVTDFLTSEYLNYNAEIFVLLCDSLLPLLKPISIISDIRKQVLQLLAVCHFSSQRSTSSYIFPSVCRAVIIMVKNWFRNISITDRRKVFEIGSSLLNDVKLLLISKTQNSIEDRYLIISITLLLHVLLDIPDSSYRDSYLGNFILSPGLMNKLLTLDDPLLLDACCLYLINSKILLHDKPTTNRYVQWENQYILDLTNYFWRNKIIATKTLCDIPTEFIRNTINNLYLPYFESKNKALFSITGIPSFSYISMKAVKSTELQLGTEVSYDESLTEEGFKKMTKKIKDREKWITGIESITDLRIKILQQLMDNNSYRNIPLFLFTYLKSLSKYNTPQPAQHI